MKINARRGVFDMPAQATPELAVIEIGCTNAKCSGRIRGIKCGRIGHVVVFEVRTGAFPHDLRVRCGHDAAPLFDEYRIVPGAAHACDRIGYRGLGHGQLFRGPRYGAFVHDGIKNNEQIEVGFFKLIHHYL